MRAEKVDGAVPSPDPEGEAFDILREVVTLARNGCRYAEPLARLKDLLPRAPGVQKAIKSWGARELMNRDL